MGYRPLVVLCLPLADLHHFCLTKRFPKTPSAIQPIGTPSAFCIDQIAPGFVVYYISQYFAFFGCPTQIQVSFQILKLCLTIEFPKESRNLSTAFLHDCSRVCFCLGASTRASAHTVQANAPAGRDAPPALTLSSVRCLQQSCRVCV